MKKKFWIAMLLSAGVPLNGMAFTVMPGRTDARLPLGDKAKTKLSVTNDSAERVHVEWDTKDWFVLPANKDLNVNKWLTVKGPRTFVLKPGETRKVPIEVKCPVETQGELVGMVSFAFQSDTPSNLLPVISVSVYMEAIGRSQISGEITALALRDAKKGTQVAVGIKSTGNVHLRPTGNVKVFTASGKEIATFLIKEGDPAYPGQERGYFAQDETLKLAPGSYQAKTEMTYRDLTLRATKEFKVSKDRTVLLAKGFQDLYSSAPGASTDSVKGAAPVQ